MAIAVRAPGQSRRVSPATEQVRLLNAELSRKAGEREDELQRLFERLRLVESQRVLEAERRRMTLDSLEPMDGDLPTILGTLRQCIAPALQAARVELDWQVKQVPPIPGLEARRVLHVFRCPQQVFANILKHAQPRRMTVIARDLRQWSSTCATTGSGWGRIRHASAPGSGGRGMGKVHLRAAELSLQGGWAPSPSESVGY